MQRIPFLLAAAFLPFLLTAQISSNTWKPVGDSGGGAVITYFEKEKMFLEINKLTDNEGKMSFSLINESDTLFRTTELRNNYNRILIQPPNEEIVEYYYWVSPMQGKSVFIDILPHERKEFQIDIEEVFEVLRFKDKGEYLIWWKINELKSNPFFYQRK